MPNPKKFTNQVPAVRLQVFTRNDAWPNRGTTPAARGVRSWSLLFLASLLTSLSLPGTDVAAQSPPNQGEFSAHGSGVMRVELEAKLRVPTEKTELVWQWLQKRYADCSWLVHGDHHFKATLGDEQFADTYFDTPDLSLLADQSGVRHRSRVVHSGSATAKDGRQLLQIKLNRNDPTGLGRLEIKFQVSPPVVSRKRKTADDLHPMLGLVDKSELQQCKDQFQDLGIDPYAMLPILTVHQNRRRVYINDERGAFATLTLDKCSTDSWGVHANWVEIELELNEIRYTEANEESRRVMEEAVAIIQRDLQQAFPDIVQDQTPKYNKGFAAIESAASIPVRRLVAWGIDYPTFSNIMQAFWIALGAILPCGALWVFRSKWMAPSTSGPVAAPRLPPATARPPVAPSPSAEMELQGSTRSGP